MSNPVKLPKSGTDRNEVLKTLQAMRDHDSNWHDGRTWSLVYHASDEHTEFLKKAYGIYFHENALNPGAFPSLKKFESEIVSMAANLFNGGESAAGTLTSGGSESVIMAVKTYRDQARLTHPEIKEPEMILPQTVHPAFEKAAAYFNVKAVHIPVTKDFKVDVDKMRAAINKNTILLVGSAPAYPHGVMDPITEIAALAAEHKIGCHVDACVGGFMLPFIKKLGGAVPDFDFSVPGVTSISADLHKYGFTAKGASVILYRDQDLRRHQFFIYSEWPGGLFASPSMSGTRPGGSIAAAWATLQAMGEDGYLKNTQLIMKTVAELQSGIRELGLEILGKPEGSVFAFATPAASEGKIDLFAVGDFMEARRWLIDRQQNPTCLHLMVTPAHAPIIGEFLKDLKDAVDYVKANPQASQQGSAAMYGMLAKIPDRTKINDFLYQHMDERYQL